MLKKALIDIQSTKRKTIMNTLNLKETLKTMYNTSKKA